MAQIELKGLNVTLGEPVVVSEAVGHLHFPGISQFPGGELLISASIVPDRAGNQISAQRIFISKDGGASWDFRYTVTEAHANAKLPRPQNDLLMKPSRLTPDPAGQWRDFVGTYVRYQDGGERILIEDGAVRVGGLPRDVAPPKLGSVLPGLVGRGALYFGSRISEVGGRLLTSPYLTYDGDEQYSTAIFASDDEGRSCQYLSTVAGPEAEHGLGHGPAEASMVELETGELMIVMREGWTGTGWPLLRSYSGDGGAT